MAPREATRALLGACRQVIDLAAIRCPSNLCGLLSGAALLFALTGCTSATNVVPKGEAYWDAWPWMATTVSGPAQLTGVLKLDSIPDRFVVTLVVANTGSTPVQLEHGACSFGLRLYRSSAQALPPAWDDRPPPGSLCILPLYQVTIAPGARHERRIGVIRPAALSDSLAPGRYGVSIAWRSSSTEVRVVPAGALDIP